MVVAVATVGGLITAAPASAHQFPAGCATNGITLTMDKNQQIVRPADVITYRMFVDNQAGTPCQVDTARMNFYAPTPSGPAILTPLIVAANQIYMGGFQQVADLLASAHGVGQHRRGRT